MRVPPVLVLGVLLRARETCWLVAEVCSGLRQAQPDLQELAFIQNAWWSSGADETVAPGPGT